MEFLGVVGGAVPSKLDWKLKRPVSPNGWGRAKIILPLLGLAAETFGMHLSEIIELINLTRCHPLKQKR